MQKSGKSTKRLDRLAPNLVNICRFIWEWTYAKNNYPLDTQGEIVGGLGGNKMQKSGKQIYQTAGPIGTKFGTRLRIHLGMDIG